MATHDYVLANQSGSSFRADLNNALAAIVSQNSNATEPATKFAYQYWVDTSATPALIKQRNAANDAWITLAEVDGQTLAANGTASKPGISFAADVNTGIKRNAADEIGIVTGGTEAVTINSSQRVGIGTTSPGSLLHVSNGNDAASGEFIGLTIGGTNVNNARTASLIKDTTTYDLIYKNNNFSSALGSHIFKNGNSEHMRIDSSGKVGIGTSSPTLATLHINQGANGFALNLQEGSSANPKILFTTTAGNTGATAIEGDPDSSSGFLAFTAGNSERLRIQSSGIVTVNTTNSNPPANSVIGTAFRADGSINTATSSTKALSIGLNTSDGTLIEFRQAGTAEGSISVSGTDVSLNGATLSRYSQLAGGAERTEILRGSVMSNLDEMCEWGEEDNEQLNRSKVSDVEGDRDVAGVFRCWDDDDDVYTNDFYLAMTGDFVIRIAQGTTVARGDLLMSAGDGTAKPQSDDIVRSKTIAKVTSTVVSETYADGSYCVPCVLMAC